MVCYWQAFPVLYIVTLYLIGLICEPLREGFDVNTLKDFENFPILQLGLGQEQKYWIAL